MRWISPRFSHHSARSHTSWSPARPKAVVAPCGLLARSDWGGTKKEKEDQAVKRAAILVMLVLLMGIAAAACGGGEGGVVDITEQELIEGVLASADAQETSRFEMNLDGGLEGTVEDEYGEIDLIMEDKKTLVFVEVRYRKSAKYGSALESVNNQKQARIIHTAKHYLQQHSSKHSAYRFDVVALTPNNIDWVKDAFQLS